MPTPSSTPSSPKSETSTLLSPHTIESIGLLGSIAGEGLVLFVREIPPLFISTLQNLQAARKKNEATLRAFNQVCARTGNVIDSPIQHPELFGAFCKLFVGKTIAIEMKLQGAARDGVLVHSIRILASTFVQIFGFVLRCH